MSESTSIASQEMPGGVTKMSIHRVLRATLTSCECPFDWWFGNKFIRDVFRDPGSHDPVDILNTTQYNVQILIHYKGC